ncbi:MAG: glucosamine-6-phosphate deaminase [Planctomycetota bacterium]
MEVIIQRDAQTASAVAARIIAGIVKGKPDAVLGLATGSTPIGLYGELVRLHREEGLDFSKVTTFNLDEYVGLEPSHSQSYHYFMFRHLFNHINVPRERIHIPDGLAADIPAHCGDYEKRIAQAGGLDVQVLGVGSDGHIAFNEPTSSLASRTRIKTITEQTRRDNARFFENESDVPRHVITMGIGTIMEARICLLLAFGPGKARAVAEAVEGPVTSMIPASILQMHPVAKMVIDEAAAADLKRSDYYRWVYDHKPDWQKQ